MLGVTSYCVIQRAGKHDSTFTYQMHFFLWTLIKFGAPIVRFSRILDLPRKGKSSGLRLGGVTPEPII